MNTRSSEVPAILGGAPAVNLDHAAILRWPRLTEEDAHAVLQVMCDGDISRHRVVRQLERAYADAIGRRHALAHCNGSAAFLAAYCALGLRPGDEVLVAATAPSTTVLPMLWLGALPIFCDIEADRMGIAPEEVDQRITPKTRAIVISHSWGMPCKLKGLLSLARKHNLKVIEDASEALGAVWREQPCGAFGDIAVFRLQGHHLAPAGEGAMLLCDDSACFESALKLGDPSRLSELATYGRPKPAIIGLGLNTRIAPLCAAIGLAQFSRLEAHNAMRNENLAYLAARLEELGLAAYPAPRHIQRVYTEFMVHYDADRHGLGTDRMIAALNHEGCEAKRPDLSPLYRHPLFAEAQYKDILRLPIHSRLPEYGAVPLPVTERLRGALIQLPAFPGPDNGILDQYICAFEKVLAHAGEIAGADNELPSRPHGGYARLRVVR